MTLPILCFDLDGTLLDHHGRIHPRDVTLLADPNPPARFVPATGRSLGSVRRTFARNGLFAGQKIPFPLILQNGSILYAGGEQLVDYLPFAPEVQSTLVDLAGQYPQVAFLFMGLEEIHVLNTGSFGESEIQRFELEVESFRQGSRSLPFGKAMFISRSSNDLAAIGAAIQDLPVEAAFSMPTALELTPLGVDKGRGLQRLCSELGLDHTAIYVAGDGENDLPMLRLARVSFAPVNALEVVRQQVKTILEVSETGLLGPMLRASLG